MAAFDAFLKLEGIEGESADKDHKGEIEVLSYSWGLSNAGSVAGGGGGAGKASLQDFFFSMPLSKASPKLMEACAMGRRFAYATLACRRAGGLQTEFLKVKLADVLISSYQTGGSEGGPGSDGAPTDQLSLNFAKIDFLYTVDKTGETVSGAAGGTSPS